MKTLFILLSIIVIPFGGIKAQNFAEINEIQLNLNPEQIMTLQMEIQKYTSNRLKIGGNSLLSDDERRDKLDQNDDQFIQAIKPLVPDEILKRPISEIITIIQKNSFIITD